MTSRLKMIQLFGEPAICITGRSLSTKYCVGQNFIEVDIDIGSSMVATAVVHLAFGYLTTRIADLAFLIEGESESELPEKTFVAIRFSELDVASARHIELTSEDSMGYASQWVGSGPMPRKTRKITLYLVLLIPLNSTQLKSYGSQDHATLDTTKI